MSYKFFEKNTLVIGGALFCCLIMVMFPEVTAQASKEAIQLWLNSIVPILLPFFIAANFLKSTGIVGRISPKIYPFAMGILSGYPMGARICGDYFRQGAVSREQLRWILSYSMITGPAFLVGTVGHEFLGSHKAGIVLAVCHYASALINGIFYRNGVSTETVAVKKTVRKERYYNIFTDAILDSFKSIGIILAYIIIFMIATDLLQFSGFLRLLPTPEAAAVMKGALEMTVGCSSLSACRCSFAVKTTLAAFIVTFGGFSVMGQSMSMLRDCDITLGEIFRMKLSQGILCAILTFSLCSFVV